MPITRLAATQDRHRTPCRRLRGSQARVVQGNRRQCPERRRHVEGHRHPATAAKSGVSFGVVLFASDTADMCGQGDNERLLGRALGGRREDVVLAPKFGNVRAPDGTSLGASGRPEYVRDACEASLRRLGVDAGRVCYLGMSEAAPATLCRACAVHPIAAPQTEYSLWIRDPEAEILATCRELKVGFVAYSPLGRGFLAGRFRTEADLGEGDWRRDLPRFRGENLAKNQRLVAVLEDLARAKGCTAAQMALACVLAQGSDVVPIPGTKHVRYLEEDLEALQIRLEEDECHPLEEAFQLGAAAESAIRRRACWQSTGECAAVPVSSGLCRPALGQAAPAGHGKGLAYLRRAVRRDVRLATLRAPTISHLLGVKFTGSLVRSGALAAGLLGLVQGLGLLGGDQADTHQVERADEAVREGEAARLPDGIAQGYRPVVLDQEQGGGRVVGDVLQHVPGELVREDLHAPGFLHGFRS
jgi:aryl-alcohol dehydrogenase-like predicted oxidoreductase